MNSKKNILLVYGVILQLTQRYLAAYQENADGGNFAKDTGGTPADVHRYDRFFVKNA